MNQDLIRYLIESGNTPEMIDDLMRRMSKQNMVNTETNRGVNNNNTLSAFGRTYNAPSRI